MNVDAAPVSDPKLIYVTPSHHCPTGVTMPLERRLRLLDAAIDAQAYIVEDDYDSELRYDGRPIAALQGIGGHKHVFYVGTFSKTMMPAIRAGFIVAPENIADELEAAQRYTGHLAATSIQAALADFITDGHYRAHIRKMCRVYKQRRDFLIELFEQEIGEHIEVIVPRGGLQVAVYFRTQLDDEKLVQNLNKDGLGPLPLSRNYTDKGRSGLYVGFGMTDDTEIAAGVRVLRRHLAEQDQSG